MREKETDTSKFYSTSSHLTKFNLNPSASLRQSKRRDKKDQFDNSAMAMLLSFIPFEQELLENLQILTCEILKKEVLRLGKFNEI